MKPVCIFIAYQSFVTIELLIKMPLTTYYNLLIYSWWQFRVSFIQSNVIQGNFRFPRIQHHYVDGKT